LGPASHYTLDLVGDGHYTSIARDFVAERGLNERVRFHGWLRGPQLRDALEAADVLVLPSWAEGMPNAVIEAMAAGVAVITTPVGSIKDFIIDGEHGLLVPPKDAKALESALRRVIEDSALRMSLGKAGHCLAATTFNGETAARLIANEISPACAGENMAAGLHING
jgi:glycosyltransferase involved in cell wall biosynthesis